MDSVARANKAASRLLIGELVQPTKILSEGYQELLHIGFGGQYRNVDPRSPARRNAQS